MKKILSIALITALISGCSTSTRIGDFTVASTKNMNVKEATHNVDYKTRLVGADTKEAFFIFPAGIPDMKEAMDNAIEKQPGAVGMSNVTVKFNRFIIPFIYESKTYEIEGNPVFQSKKS